MRLCPLPFVATRLAYERNEILANNDLNLLLPVSCGSNDHPMLVIGFINPRDSLEIDVAAQTLPRKLLSRKPFSAAWAATAPSSERYKRDNQEQSRKPCDDCVTIAGRLVVCC